MLPRGIERFVVIGLVLVVSVVVGSTLLFRYASSPVSTSVSKDIFRLVPTGLTSSSAQNIKIIHKVPGDTNDRTVLYEKDGYSYSGSGIFYGKGADSEKVAVMIGIFDRWESISNSRDRYLFLDDPLKKQKLPEIRVAFQSSPLFAGTATSTLIAVESLNTGDITLLDKKVGSLSTVTLDALIKPGDALEVAPLYVNNNPVYDASHILYASFIVVRRNSSESVINL